MNRHERRKRRSMQPKCMSCGDRKRPQHKSAVDGKVRCTICHAMHIEHVGDISQASDEMTDMRHVKAQQLQEALHKAVLSVYPDKKDFDVPNIIWSLGILAGTFAVQAEVTRKDFVAAMSTWMGQVQEALGAQEPEQDEESPRIILPS